MCTSNNTPTYLPEDGFILPCKKIEKFTFSIVFISKKRLIESTPLPPPIKLKKHLKIFFITK